MQISKAEIRKKILSLRTSIPNDEVEKKSVSINEKLMGLAAFDASNVIMCYMDFRNEVITRSFIKKCLDMGKRVSIPYIINLQEGRKDIEASELKDPDNDLEQGTFGILEPRKNLIRKMNVHDIDMVVVPGVAFDAMRNRIGYGAGFYDRFLKKVRNNCFKVGIAFELQVIERIPADEFDMPMDIIITESRIYKDRTLLS